jgi:hypothetical protein
MGCARRGKKTARAWFMPVHLLRIFEMEFVRQQRGNPGQVGPDWRSWKYCAQEK